AFEKKLPGNGSSVRPSPHAPRRTLARPAEAHRSSPTGKAMSNKRSRSRRRSVSCNRSSASQQEHQCHSVTFNIFARSQAAIKSAVDGLKQLCDKECAEIVLNNQSAIAKLTVGQISQIKSLEDKLDVKIVITNTTSCKHIVIQGTAANTMQAQSKILQIFINVVEADGKEMVESVISKQVQWKYADGGVFKSYPPAINCLLETAYKDNKDQAEWKTSTGETSRVKFDTMIETSDINPYKVAVKRFVIGDDTELPAIWSPMAKTDHVMPVTLQPTSDEYRRVKDLFTSSAQGTVKRVMSIERVQNPSLYRQYMLHKEEMKKRSQRPSAIERSLWHGTSAEATQSINVGGFNRSYCGKNATVYGKGVYFAVKSEYSAQSRFATPDATGLKFVYKSLVLTGDYTIGNSSYNVPPSNPLTPGFQYDTVVDSLDVPNIFVVFLDNQAYPEYLITFL
ncbi:Protein mono-ADP-ribosyltransferase PARP14, partial [Lamellibrachia satsuma]